jgi:predicted glutamine amidotransferase
MCGIAGLSMSKNSKINVRRLSHELLSFLEMRGGHASGFAYTDRKNRQGIYKDAKPGSQLPLYELPRNAKTAILHTRYATQGDPSDNRNNHPVMSKSGEIALVHNGVISNDLELSRTYPVVGDVDSAIIPAIIEAEGLDEGVKKLEGYAAIAYLTKTQPDTMIVARLSSSPVVYTWTMDGSFVFASTEAILEAALMAARIEYGYVFSMGEGEGLAVRNGVIVDVFTDLEMQEDTYTYWRYSSATAGGHSSTTRTTTTSTDGDSCQIGSSFGEIERGSESNPNSSPWWDDIDIDPIDRPMYAFGQETNNPPKIGDEGFGGYYLTREDGNIEMYTTLDDLEKELAWLANLHLYDGAPFPEAGHSTKWTNFVVDLGEVRNNTPRSWLDDLALVDDHESSVMYNLQYIRDGLGDLIMARN